MFIKRHYEIEKHLKEKSILLLGPRRTGKSMYIMSQLRPDRYIDLLSSEVYKMLSYNISLLGRLIKKNDTIIAIDEVQKLPNLMDEVHSLIEKNKKLRFVLTGSSVKNIKRTHTSLMAGRVRQMFFLPFDYNEIKTNFDLEKYLNYGGLPVVYLSENPWDELKDYAGTYLTEEIQQSAFVRKIENYSKFLNFAAKTSGQVLNYEGLARDAMIPGRTIRDYYDLLEETMIGYTVKPLRKVGSRKEIATSKFYFFDIGVMNSLIGKRKIIKNSSEYGMLFEHFIFLELKSYQLKTRADWNICFWRTHLQDEVDFVLNNGEIAIEVKAAKKITKKHINGLQKFSSEFNCKRKIVISQSEQVQKIDDVEVYPWQKFLEELWKNHII